MDTQVNDIKPEEQLPAGPHPAKKTDKKVLKIIIPVICVVCLLVVFLVVFLMIPNESVSDKALKLMEEQDYATAKAVLLDESPDKYDPVLLVQCNLGLIRQAIQKTGRNSINDDNSTSTNDKARYYLEIDDEQVIFGLIKTLSKYESLVFISTNSDMKLYLDGSANVDFTRDASGTFPLTSSEEDYDGTVTVSFDYVTIKSKGDGTIDLSRQFSRVNLENFQSDLSSAEAGSNDSARITHSSITNAGRFEDAADEEVNEMFQEFKVLMKRLDLDLTIEDLYC